MSLDVSIIYKEPKQSNYFLEHPYSYDYLSEQDKKAYFEETRWHANITHNLNEMADHIPIIFKDKNTTLYYVCWHPENIGIKTVNDILPYLIEGIHHMFPIH